MIDLYTLISGASYDCDGITIYQPKLSDLRDIGYENYQMLLAIFLTSKDDILKSLDATDVTLKDKFKDVTLMQLVTVVPQLRGKLLDAISFFTHRRAYYSDESGYGLDPDTYISLEVIQKIKRIALEFACINLEDEEHEPDITSLDEKALARYEKIKKYKKNFKKAQKQEQNKDLELPNLIAAMAAVSPSYNLCNIWDLTIYQFYDQFARLNNKIQLDVYGQRWAAWGKEDFDFSIWHKALSK